MESVVSILIVISIVLFSIDAFRCFSNVCKFNRENGYRDETICYIKSPHIALTKRGKLIFMISKWSVIFLIVGLWLAAIYLLVFKGMKFQGMVLIFCGYMLVVLWYEVYATINGAKILDTGIAHGLEKISWDKIEEFQFNNKTNKFLNKTYIKLKYQGRMMPKYIEITTENKELVKRLFKEKCAL